MSRPGTPLAGFGPADPRLAEVLGFVEEVLAHGVPGGFTPVVERAAPLRMSMLEHDPIELPSGRVSLIATPDGIHVEGRGDARISVSLKVAIPRSMGCGPDQVPWGLRRVRDALRALPRQRSSRLEAAQTELRRLADICAIRAGLDGLGFVGLQTSAFGVPGHLLCGDPIASARLAEWVRPLLPSLAIFDLSQTPSGLTFEIKRAAHPVVPLADPVALMRLAPTLPEELR